MRRPIAPLLLLILLALPACRATLDTQACADRARANTAMTCGVPGFEDRAYDLIVPGSYDGQRPIPLLLVMHGGGGDREGALRTACPEGDLRAPSCLHAQAAARGYAVVAPDGTAGRVGNFRTWNAGGGVDGFRCTSGLACEQQVPDVAYFRALLDHVSTRLQVDPGRVYATGLSNGGAISHRLACELSDRITAIAPIGGGMQLTVGAECSPARPVPVLHVHGTEDPCWRYEGGEPRCARWFVGQPGLKHVAISRTMDEWARINGCTGETLQEPLPDTSEDGTSTQRIAWQGCAADTVLLRIDGGGHTWPRGWQYLREGTIGPVPRDWGNDVLLDWFDAHSM